METWVPVAISILSAVATIAVVWGKYTAEIDEMKRRSAADTENNNRRFAAMEKEMEKKVDDKTCSLKHCRVDEIMNEIRDSLNKILSMLMEQGAKRDSK